MQRQWRYKACEREKSRARRYWRHKNACFILNIVFHSGQIEQFFLLKRHFPGLCACTQLFSPKILCLRAPCRQSHGSVYTRMEVHVHPQTHTDLKLQNSWEAQIVALQMNSNLKQAVYRLFCDFDDGNIIRLAERKCQHFLSLCTVCTAPSTTGWQMRGQLPDVLMGDTMWRKSRVW